MLKKVLTLALVFTLTLCLAAVAQAGEITVSAAASLTNAFTEVKAAFEKKNPSIKVTTNFAASNPLLKQIETGAPVDVFASADQATMDKAQNQNFIAAGTRKNFAANSLVLIVPASSTATLKKAEELTSAQYTRVAVGNPD
ncbi:molybdate ABC transporter substrate-binding protein, partial [Desulfovibrio sp. OttesenSCG-928-F07]|nr:molybdate ABC transporter substrate-binding protein [Desulfovibrio sp. OttesenSCG-928-F07]